MTPPSLVLVPFNAAASCPLLLQGMLAMLREEYEEYAFGKAPYSYAFKMRDRFVLRGWTSLFEGTGRVPDFLAQETEEVYKTEQGPTVTKRAFLLADAGKQNVYGELWLTSKSSEPTVVDAFDVLRPTYRGQGLSLPFLRLACQKASALGYAQLHCGVRSDAPASHQRLDKLVAEGLAVRAPDKDWAKHYTIALNAFA